MIKKSFLKKIQPKHAPVLCLIAAIILVFIKLMLTLEQRAYLYLPDFARLDDTLVLESAISISSGNWLGSYNYLTLSKHMFFSVWLSLVNASGVSFLIAGQLLWALACALFVYAVMPIIKPYAWRLALFAVLLYNPAASAARVQLRAYRDNIFPALCLLCVAGAIGAALRYKAHIRGYIFSLFICAVGLALAYTTREDGAWIGVFAVPALFITALYIAFDKEMHKKLVRIIALAIPFCVTICVILSFCAMNYKHYGRFVLSDFTSAEFKDAYGAMTRVEHENWKPKVAVPRDVRYKLYANSPSLAPLEPLLEAAAVLNGYGTAEKDDLSSAGFYWVLRQVAAEKGHYKNAQTAKKYWQAVATEINSACDSGALKAAPRRSSTLSPMRAEYILPTIGKTFSNLWRTITFSEAEPAYSEASLGHGSPELTRYESFLNHRANSVALENSSEAFYSPKEKRAHFVLNIILWAYSILIPIAFVLALAWLCEALYAAIAGKSAQGLLSALIVLGVLLTGLVRCGIVAFIFESSFNFNLEKIMYLSSAHPLFIAFAIMGTYFFVQAALKCKEKKVWLS